MRNWFRIAVARYAFIGFSYTPHVKIETAIGIDADAHALYIPMLIA